MTQPAGALAPTDPAPTDPAPTDPAQVDPAPPRDLVAASFGSFTLVGMSLMLVPSLIRDVQAAYRADDAAMGAAYLLSSLLYAGGAILTGVAARHVPRRLLLAAGPALVAVGASAMAATGAWPVFLGGFMLLGFGVGNLDAGTNALVLDLAPGKAGLLTRAHLFAAGGGLVAPLAVGVLVGGGAPWQAAVLALAIVAAVVAVGIATRRLPPTHPELPREPVASVAGDAPGPAVSHGRERGIGLALGALAVAIGCYIAMELGVANWLVRYLEGVPLEIATGAVALFWAGLTVARFLTAFVADRLPMVPFVSLCCAVCAVAVAGAVAAPNVPLAIAGFAIAGFAAGPIYPGIMAIGGVLHPGRSSMVGSVLASSAIVGTIVWPPAMGVISEAAGLGTGMLGAAVFVALAAGAVAITPRLARRHRLAATPA